MEKLAEQLGSGCRSHPQRILDALEGRVWTDAKYRMQLEKWGDDLPRSQASGMVAQ